MSKVARLIILCVVLLLGLATAISLVQPALAAGATTEVHLVKYAEDGSTMLEEKTVSYEWLENNLPVQGDGVTHRYHQGPVFEGDKWDPDEVTNFKDKGAVKGTNVKDLCDLVGGMSPGDEVMIRAVDGYHVEYGYTTVYEPLERQGPIVLCWYNGEDALDGERYGEGYPGKSAYRTAMQIVLFADDSSNPEGKHVFGNWDMHECLPEKCQHFYEAYPSTNGLSMKWVDEIRIYTGGYTGEGGKPVKAMPDDISESGQVPWVPIVGGVVGGLLVIGLAVYFLRRRKVEKAG